MRSSDRRASRLGVFTACEVTPEAPRTNAIFRSTSQQVGRFYVLQESNHQSKERTGWEVLRLARLSSQQEASRTNATQAVAAAAQVAEANQRQEAHVPPTPPNPKLQQKAEARGHSISMSAAAECGDLSQNGNGRAAEYLYFARGNDLGAPWVATSANGDPIDSNKISFTKYFH